MNQKSVMTARSAKAGNGTVRLCWSCEELAKDAYHVEKVLELTDRTVCGHCGKKRTCGIYVLTPKRRKTRSEDFVNE